MSDDLLAAAAQIDSRIPDQPQRTTGPVPPPQPIMSAASTGGHNPDAEVIMALQTLVAGGAGVLANYFDSEHWNLSVDESKTLATSIDAVLAKYLKDNYKMPVEMTLVLTVLLVFAPRYAQQRELDAKKAKSTTEKPTHADTGDLGLREVHGPEIAAGTQPI